MHSVAKFVSLAYCREFKLTSLKVRLILSDILIRDYSVYILVSVKTFMWREGAIDWTPLKRLVCVCEFRAYQVILV